MDSTQVWTAQLGKEAGGKIALEERESGNTEMFSQQIASYPGSLVE